MSTDLSLDRHSKLADFELLAGGRSYRVNQVSRDFILLDRAEAIPAGPAVLLIRVEGEDEIRREIQVVPESDAKSRRIPILRS